MNTQALKELLLKRYRLEFATGCVAIALVFCYIAWSAPGKLLDANFAGLFRLEEAVRHKATGAVLATGTSRRTAVEDHVDRVRWRWVRFMQRAGTGRGAGEPGSSQEEIRRDMESMLSGAELRSVDFSSAELKGLYLRDAWCDGADFTGAQLRYARLEGSRLVGVQLDGADLLEASLARVDLHGSTCTKANFTRAKLNDANLSGCDISGANFTNADCSGADFSGVKWSRETSFENATLDGAKGIPPALRSRAGSADTAVGVAVQGVSVESPRRAS